MNPQTFIAASAAEAVSQIRGELGPEALVLNVRKIPGKGLTRLWRKPRIEVVACAPAPRLPPPTDFLAELRLELAALKVQIANRYSGPTESPPAPGPAPAHSAAFPAPALQSWIERNGLLPSHAERLIRQVQRKAQPRPTGPADTHLHASASTGKTPSSRFTPLSDFAQELEIARGVLASWWPPSRPLVSNRHVLIGPAGTGKTTALCKWLAQAVLAGGRRARVWRLDAESANTAERLDVLAEVLGVTVERVQTETQDPDSAELVFIDIPGVNSRDPEAIAALGSVVAGLGDVEVHMVLNVAYETPVLLAQARAFEQLPVSDLILTHLDEEPRWGKLWNLVLGTNYTVRFLCAGQNVPGTFAAPEPQKLLALEPS
jgi:flagellar biosynthesis protein FlhF